MHAAKKIRKLWEDDSQDHGVIMLIALADALDREQDFHLEKLYDLSSKHFELALELMNDWRLGRHTTARGKLAATLQKSEASH